MGSHIQNSYNTNNTKRHKRSRRRGIMSDINITPMVDVMLVLLIVFMVAAPMMTVGVPLNLPKTKAAALEASKKKPLSISITKDNKIYLQKTVVSLDELPQKLKLIADNRGSGYSEKIFVMADKDVDYGTVVKVIAAINVKGFTKIALKTDQDN